MVRRRLLTSGALLALAVPPTLQATMLMVVYTPDGYWIGADSARSSGKHVQTVCKVHEIKFGLLLKSGRSQGTSAEGDDYSTDKEIEDLLAVSTSAEEFKANLRSRFKQDIETELLYILDDPLITLHTLGTTAFRAPIPEHLDVILMRAADLFEPKGEHVLGEALEVRPESDPVFDPRTGLTAYHYWAPSVLGWHPIEDLKSSVTLIETGTTISYPDSVRMLSYPVAYNRPDSWVRIHPKEALLEMLKQGHEEQLEQIGPPYVLVHVVRRNGQKQSIQWVERGVCPSWTENVLSDDPVRDSRNP